MFSAAVAGSKTSNVMLATYPVLAYMRLCVLLPIREIDTAATPPGSSSLSVTDSVETVTGPPKPSLTYIPPKFRELQLKHEGFGGPGGNRTLVRNREDDLSSHERYTPHC